ncbi:MAG: alpha-E domain-containing protein, partial [Bacteroidota bacterium]
EHLARYLRVQYFSMLDAPMSQSRNFTLNSILNMYGVEWPEEEPLVEAAVLRKVGTDYNTPLSIRSTIRAARENARVLRHVISTELWESINAFHLEAQGLDPDFFATHGLYEFTVKVGEHCAIIRSRVDDTLLQDEAWSLLKLGIHLERVVQVIRILNSKLYDIDVMTDRGANRALRQYQGTVILKILEGFDMHRQAYRQLLTPQTMVEFLVGHPHFSRSITYNMNAVRKLLARMDHDTTERNPVSFQAGKLYNYFHYLEYADIADDVGGQLDRALQRVYNLHDAISQKYFQLS